jgi:site-specific DNA recombinase
MKKQTPTTTTAKDKSADIYIRVSGVYDERTASLDSQERACRELVEKNGYIVGQVFVERQTGKSLHKRKELTKLRERVSNGETQCIAFYDIDRFTRGGYGHIWILIGECREKGVKLLCVTQDLSDTFENNVVITVKAEAARKEIESIRERTLRGRKEKLRKGTLPGQGGDMIGYRINKETWKREIHEPEAEIIRRIFEEAASGKTYRQITLDLQADEIPSPGELLNRNYKTAKTPRWHRSAVAAIITNPAYAGTTLAQVWSKDETGKRIRNDSSKIVELNDVTPAIVSKELWEKANATRQQRLSADTTRNEKNFILLRGLVFCKRCHRKMRPKQARTFWSFRCASKTDESLDESCGSPTVSIRWLTNRVWDTMRSEFKKRDSLQRMIDGLSNHDQKDRLLKDQERLEEKIQEIEGRTNRLLKLVSRSDDEMMTDLYEREIKILADHRRGIEESLQQIQFSIREVEASMPHVPTLIELHNRFAWGEESWTDQQKRNELLRSGLRIYVDGREFEIRLPSGKVVGKFKESDALLAYDKDFNEELEQGLLTDPTTYIPPWP